MPTDTRNALLSHALIGYEERKKEITETIARIRATLDGKEATTTTPSPEPIHAPTPPAQAWHDVPCRPQANGPADETALGEGEEGGEEEVGVNRSVVYYDRG